MEETDDSLDDWRDLMMSPNGLLSGCMSDPCFTNSVSDELSGGESRSEARVFMSNPEAKLVKDEIREDSVMVMDNIVANIGESIVEKFDFNDASPLASSGSPSPCLTIPSGISPNELLGSPVMLPNSQLSPTTGTLDPDHDNPTFHSALISADKEQNSDDFSSFRFKHQVNPVSFPAYSLQTQRLKSEDDCQSLVPVQPQRGYEFFGQQENAKLSSLGFESAGTTISNSIGVKSEASAFQLSSHSYGIADSEMRETNETAAVADTVGGQSMDVVQKGLYPSSGTTKSSEDGYNWRKYGQKQVKGSDYPRSYYKCTNPSCLVKKKVERSHDGEITEIIYKGAHNHSKPQPSRRSSNGSNAPSGESTDIGDPLWREMQQGYNNKDNSKVGSEWRSEGLEITSSTSVVTEVSDPHSSSQKPMSGIESAETPELASTLGSHDEEEEDTTTQGSLSVGEDDDTETESKRRRKESSLIETALGSRALREPRVIVQIESEIDIIDDGYRWRKYGQKVVKGNPNPRSYYKCTSAGCTVRKHVERASHNLKFVLTTYEGKHNHVVPAARNSNQINSSNGNLLPSSSQSTLTLPRNSHLPKTEPQDFVPPFDRKMEYETEFLRPNYLGSFSGAPSSLYQHMNFPTVPNSGLYGPFGINPNYTSSAPPMIPSVRNLSIPLPMNLSLRSNFAMAGYNHQGRPLNPVPPFYMVPQMKDNDVKLLRPKQEQ